MKQAKQGAKRPHSTALAKRTPPKKKQTILRPAKMPQPKALTVTEPPKPPDILSTHHLDESIALGEFGLVEVKFTADEEMALSTPVPFEDMRVLPTGQVYLPHITYTRLLNRAFGRTGWALRPASKPLLNENTVVVPYLLMVHGKPVAFALGEQEYFSNNKNQSYGDALEATVASGLRRTCKHLGIGLELWDKAFNDAYLEEHCVRLWNEGSKSNNKWEYRRKIDPPFFWEKKSKSGQRRQEHDEEQDQRREPPRDVSTAMHHPHENEPITQEQVRRFWTIARKRGRTDDEVKAYLMMKFSVSSTKELKRKDYESATNALEHPGPLNPAPEREAGEEG